MKKIITFVLMALILTVSFANAKNFARIKDGVVKEILVAPTLPPFHPSLVWVECVSCQPGWLYDGSTFSAPPPPPPPTQAEIDRAARRSRILNHAQTGPGQTPQELSAAIKDLAAELRGQ